MRCGGDHEGKLVVQFRLISFLVNREGTVFDISHQNMFPLVKWAKYVAKSHNCSYVNIIQ